MRERFIYEACETEFEADTPGGSMVYGGVQGVWESIMACLTSEAR